MNTFKPLIAQTKPMSHLASLEELQSNRLKDEPDYKDKLFPKFVELLNMTNWIIPEAWENGLGKSFKEVKNG